MNAFQDTDENKRISLEDLVDVWKTFYIASHQFLVCMDYLAFCNPSRFGQQKPNPDGIAKPKILRKLRNTIIKFLPMSANYLINPYPFHFNLSPVFLWFCFFHVGEHDYQ
jgi:hypothetical protein